MAGRVRFDFHDQVALVTGASRGIGRAIALEFGLAGGFVVVNYLNSEEAACDVVARIASHGGRAVAIKADVSQADQVGELVEGTLKTFGKIDILVNNAGINEKEGYLVRLSEERWDRVVGTKLKGTFLCTKAVVRGMLRGESGRIVNIGSVVGRSGNRGQADYVAANAAIIGFTKSTSLEYAAKGILTNAVLPGVIDTDLWQRALPEAKDFLLSLIPVQVDGKGRPGTSEEVAKVVAFLCSEGASYITGALICVDGGMPIS